MATVSVERVQFQYFPEDLLFVRKETSSAVTRVPKEKGVLYKYVHINIPITKKSIL